MGPAPRLSDNFHLVKGNMRRGPVDPCLWLAEGARPLQEHVQSGCARVWVSVSSTNQGHRHSRFTSLALAGGRRERGPLPGERATRRSNIAIVGVLILSHLFHSHTPIKPQPQCTTLSYTSLWLSETLMCGHQEAEISGTERERCCAMPHELLLKGISASSFFLFVQMYMFLILLLINSLIPHPYPHTQEDGASTHARVQPWRLW